MREAVVGCQDEEEVGLVRVVRRHPCPHQVLVDVALRRTAWHQQRWARWRENHFGPQQARPALAHYLGRSAIDVGEAQTIAAVFVDIVLPVEADCRWDVVGVDEGCSRM